MFICRKKRTEEAGKLLHAEQKKLVLEEEKVRQATNKLSYLRKSRSKVENKNAKLRETLATLENEVESKMNEQDEARERMNLVANHLLKVQMRRLEVENKIGLDQEHVNKGEEDLKQVHETKEAQDAYITRLTEQGEQLTLQLEQCKGQTQAMEASTSETIANLKKAEEELKTVQAEKKRMFANWSNAVININKRDEALSNFQEAVENKKTDFKSVKAKIEKTKNEIVVCQTEHEMVTGIVNRMEKFCQSKKHQISKNRKETAEEKLELARLNKVRGETDTMLQTIEFDLKSLEKENAIVCNKILQLEFEKRELDIKVFESLRDQMANEKSSTEADRQIKEAKEKITSIEAKLKIEKSKLIELDKEIESLKLTQLTERHKRDELALQTSQLEEEEKKVSDALRSSSFAIDKIQSLINHAEIEFSTLSERHGSKSSPLEAEIAKCREEMDLVSKYCVEKKKEWTKKQNQLIKVHIQQDEARQELEQAKNKYSILLEKKTKHEEDILRFINDLSKIRKRIENLDVKIKKLNTSYANAKVEYEELDSKRSTQKADNLALAADIGEEIDALKNEISALETSQQISLMGVREADKELSEIEDKVKSCQDTASHVGGEKQKVRFQ